MKHSLIQLCTEGFWFCWHCDRIVNLDLDHDSPARCPRCRKRTAEWQKPVLDIKDFKTTERSPV